MTLGFKLLVFPVCLVVGMIGWGMLRGGLQQRANVGRYQDSGVQIQATVLRVVRREVPAADSRDQSSFYDQPIVQYRVGGAIYDVQMEQSRADVRFQAGQKVDVVYLPDDPSKAKLKDGLGNSWLPTAGAGAVMLLASVGILAGTLVSARSRR